mgnify:CR=1 FL=1
MSLLLDVNFWDWIVAWFNLIPKFLYFICVSAMSLLDAMQLALRKLAGLDSYYVDGASKTGDIGLSFIQSIFEANSKYPAIKNAFWALVIFGVILLIVATIIAVVRQEYMPDGDSLKEKPSNNKLIIISKSIKSLFLFFIVPLSCVFGLMLSDIILAALDNVTKSNYGGELFSSEQIVNKLESHETYAGSGNYSYTNYDLFGGKIASNTTTFSGVMFKTAAYTCNRIRKNETIKYSGQSKGYYEYIRQNELSNFGIFNQGNSQEECAQILDEAFANCVVLKTPDSLIIDDGPMNDVNALDIFGVSNSKKISAFSKYNVGLVWYYYDLWEFNFIIGFAFLIVSLKLFVNIILGLMKRIVEMTALFIISPPIIAVMPLDGGKSFNEWRKNFLSKALTAYGAIIGMNLFFLILPYLNRIDFFPPVNGAVHILNLIISSLFILVGLMSVEGFIGLLSGLIGAGDAAKTGADIAESIGATLAKSAKFTGAAAGLATAPYRAATGAVVKKVGNAGAKAIYAKSNKKAETVGKRNAQDNWEKGGAEQAYDEYLNNDQEFKNEMSQRYANRTDKSQSYDDWYKTAEGYKAKEEVANNMTSRASNPLQTFNDFSNASTGAGLDAFNNQAKSFVDQELNKAKTERTAKIANAISNIPGVKNVNSYGSIYLDEVKGGFIRGGKGGFKSMQMAFKGMSAKEIEQQEIYKRIQKEETARQKIQKEVEEKYNKK